MKKILNKKGEGYIDTCVGLIVLLMALVLTINIYTFFTLKQDLDEISTNLIEIATYEGEFGAGFERRKAELENEFFEFEAIPYSDQYFNESLKRVQLGKTMTVTVKVKREIQGTGIFHIPVTATSTRSGISEKYWKN